MAAAAGTARPPGATLRFAADAARIPKTAVATAAAELAVANAASELAVANAASDSAVAAVADAAAELAVANAASDSAVAAEGAVADAAAESGADLWLVLDPAWTPSAADRAAGRLALRELAAEVLAAEDLFPTTTRLLDDWAEASGIVDAMTVDGTSFWYRRRLWAWRWLHERLIWIAILDRLAANRALAAIELPGADETALTEVATLVGRRDGVELVGGPGRTGRAGATKDETDDGTDDLSNRPAAGIDRSTGVAAARRPAAAPTIVDRALDAARDVAQRIGLRAVDRRRRQIAGRRAMMDSRLDALIGDPLRRLLVITDPSIHQDVTNAIGQQRIDPFLGPVVERLAGTGLEPIVLELGSRIEDEATWARLGGEDHGRILNGDALVRRFAEPDDEAASVTTAVAVRTAIGRCVAPLEIGRADLAPALLAGLAGFAAQALPARLREVSRARRLLAAVRPAALLTIDEYGRTEWLSAARQLDVPVAAVQHGIIHAWHPGYQHRSRPASRPVPDRTYCFGDFERRLLIEAGGYGADEVVVAGSPRLDLVGENLPESELERLRTGLGVPSGERMLVVSTTFAAVYRRFYAPVALAALVGRPLPGVHIVIKLHPGEADGELYERLLAGVAGGPRTDVSIVKRVDLYRLLSAATAHLGLYSTVLTDAVATGTPNLIAATQAASDLLGYVAAGVAIPVADEAGVRDALAPDRPGLDPDARQAFLDDHFRPGSAADRIAADLLAWLAAPAT